MRFQSGFSARTKRVAMETRAIERPFLVQEVLAVVVMVDITSTTLILKNQAISILQQVLLILAAVVAAVVSMVIIYLAHPADLV